MNRIVTAVTAVTGPIGRGVSTTANALKANDFKLLKKLTLLFSMYAFYSLRETRRLDIQNGRVSDFQFPTMIDAPISRADEPPALLFPHGAPCG